MNNYSNRLGILPGEWDYSNCPAGTTYISVSDKCEPINQTVEEPEIIDQGDAKVLVSEEKKSAFNKLINTFKEYPIAIIGPIAAIGFLIVLKGDN